ncbi:MAG: dehydrogenase [Nitrospiraceae bacterium]|nr:dehydrogenase [Nitrospiraceae bacterium]|tara:strand:+ start:2743 stop:3450 length:708 start_codon:yes stop_codon:yes gene_type:complete
MKPTRALVTGGTRGIGEATASALLEAGYEVFVSGTTPDGHGPKGSSYLCCDFEDSSALSCFVDTVAGLDVGVLVNNAGINKIGSFEDYTMEDFDRIQRVNVTAPYRICQAAVSGMRKGRFGRIVNITSVFGVVSKAERAAYSTSKFALLGLSRALALEVAADNVLVNCVAPGFVDTELTRRILGAKGIETIIASVPMGRLALPGEIARFVRFLVSEDNSYMTGQHVIVDGGYTSA